MSLPPRFSVILRLELERGAVHAVSQPALLARTVRKYMPEMAFAARTDHFGADHAVRGIAVLFDRALFGRPREARPARAAVELGVAREQRLPACGADVFSRGLVLLVLAGESPFSARLAQDLVLLRRQPFAPLGVGQYQLLGHRGLLFGEIWGAKFREQLVHGLAPLHHFMGRSGRRPYAFTSA